MSDLSIALRRGTICNEIFEQFRNLYREGLFCDLDIVCGEGTRMPCHSLVLGAASTLWAKAALADLHRAAGEDKLLLLAPDHSPGQVRHLLDHLYCVSSDPATCCDDGLLSPDLLLDFGLDRMWTPQCFPLKQEDASDDGTVSPVIEAKEADSEGGGHDSALVAHTVQVERVRWIRGPTKSVARQAKKRSHGIGSKGSDR